MQNSYQIIRSRRKTIGLVVQPNGNLIIRAPFHVSKGQIQALVDEHIDWIKKQQNQMYQAMRRYPPKKYQDGETFHYLGDLYPLKFVDNLHPYFLFDGKNFLLDKKVIRHVKTFFEKWYREQARQVITIRVEKIARQYGFKYQKIRISSALTRWGSWSSKGTLSFTWRLVKSPLPVIDSVIVHELAHTRYHNHSKDFWALVYTIMPDYHRYEEWLKENKGLLTQD